MEIKKIIIFSVISFLIFNFLINKDQCFASSQEKIACSDGSYLLLNEDDFSEPVQLECNLISQDEYELSNKEKDVLPNHDLNFYVKNNILDEQSFYYYDYKSGDWIKLSQKNDQGYLEIKLFKLGRIKLLDNPQANSQTPEISFYQILIVILILLLISGVLYWQIINKIDKNWHL